MEDENLLVRRERALRKLRAALQLYHDLNVRCPHCGRYVIADREGGYATETHHRTASASSRR